MNLPLYNQNDLIFLTKHLLDDNTVAQFVEMIHECFYLKMLHHVMIYQSLVFDKIHLYNSRRLVINHPKVHGIQQQQIPKNNWIYLLNLLLLIGYN